MDGQSQAQSSEDSSRAEERSTTARAIKRTRHRLPEPHTHKRPRQHSPPEAPTHDHIDPALDKLDNLTYQRKGDTPPPTAGINPRDIFESSHSLSKPRWRPSDSVPGYGESWTARKAAIYGISL